MATVAPAAVGGAAQAWWLAVRPRTLLAGAAPVAVGTAVASFEGSAGAVPAVAALVGALALQIACNLANDWFDAESGVDTDERIGPARATQSGWMTSVQMKLGVAIALGVAGAAGLVLVAVAGWPILVVGVLSALAALGYAGGPWPFGHHGLGDAAVFLFFGIVAVMGTAYVQTGSLSALAAAASIPVGALSAAILVVNNVRDLETDAKAGKRTLAVRLGPRLARGEYDVLMAVAYASLLLCVAAGAPLGVALPLLTAPWAWRLASHVRVTSGPALNADLGGTAQLMGAFCVLMAAGMLG